MTIIVQSPTSVTVDGSNYGPVCDTITNNRHLASDVQISLEAWHAQLIADHAAALKAQADGHAVAVQAIRDEQAAKDAAQAKAAADAQAAQQAAQAAQQAQVEAANAQTAQANAVVQALRDELSPPGTFSRLQFRDKFTAEEWATIRAGCATDENLARFYETWLAADYINPADPMTIAGLGYLASVSLLTPERMASILSQ